MDREVNRLKRGLALAASMVILLPEGAYACTMCFGGGVDSATMRGISMAMLGLLVLVGIVWGGIGMFFINMRRRAKRLDPGAFVVTAEGNLEPLDPGEPH